MSHANEIIIRMMNDTDTKSTEVRLALEYRKVELGGMVIRTLIFSVELTSNWASSSPLELEMKTDIIRVSELV